MSPNAQCCTSKLTLSRPLANLTAQYFPVTQHRDGAQAGAASETPVETPEWASLSASPLGAQDDHPGDDRDAPQSTDPEPWRHRQPNLRRTHQRLSLMFVFCLTKRA